jgi:hypothetical protein
MVAILTCERVLTDRTFRSVLSIEITKCPYPLSGVFKDRIHTDVEQKDALIAWTNMSMLIIHVMHQGYATEIWKTHATATGHTIGASSSSVDL